MNGRLARFLARISLVFALLALPAGVLAQGVLIVVDPDVQVRLPRPPYYFHHHWPRPVPMPVASYKIKELDVEARLVDQVARVQVSQTFENTGSRPLEVSFVFPLPYDGAVDQLTLMVDGKEFPAKLLDAAEARRMYEEIVRKNRDPALLEWLGTGLFKTSVFPVPPGAKRTVSLRYSQICRKQEGLTDFLFPLSTAKYTSDAVEKVAFRVTIESREKIKNIYSPTHDVNISRGDARHVTVNYEVKNSVPSSDFRLLYDVGQGRLGAQVLSYRPSGDEDGFFLLLATPDIKSPDEKMAAKTVIFVVDRSGSMVGEKIKQARGALKFVLDNLHEGDLFNIVAYDSQVETFRPELQRYNDETRAAAVGFVEGIYAGGSTDINAALTTALGQLKDDERPSYVVFLTDGLPTVGELNEMAIARNAERNNDVRARVFAFGVGYDVNSRLLDRLARDNFGQSEYVRPNEDIETHVSRLYRRIESPVLTDVEVEFVFDQPQDKYVKPINRVYPSGRFDLFAGEQLVVVGRYKTPGAAKVILRGKVGEKREQFDFPAELTAKSTDDSQGFVEKLWAVRRVGEILDEMDLKGKNEELVKELVALATRHGILTPYTSFMADENTNINDLTRNAIRAGERLVELSATDGRHGVAQRTFKGSMQKAALAPAAMATSPADASVMREGGSGGGGMGGMGFGGMGG
ncbi:MAG TPA: VIT domain-containing protein, partial [Thermoguttaceae bacterium]|nr:VIT domain-containing protein [Thermoguttaceae bacterium]